MSRPAPRRRPVRAGTPVVARRRDHAAGGDGRSVRRVHDEPARFAAVGFPATDRLDYVRHELTARRPSVVVQPVVERLDVDARRKAEVVLEVGTPLDRRAPAVEDDGVKPLAGAEHARRAA